MAARQAASALHGRTGCPCRHTPSNERAMRKLHAVLAIALCGSTSVASAQQVNTRAALNGILATSATENFETFSGIGFGGAAYLNVTTLDNSTNTAFGYGVSTPGVQFVGGNIQLNAAGYYGSSSYNIDASGTA